jgi:hypothetical protein
VIPLKPVLPARRGHLRKRNIKHARPRRKRSRASCEHGSTATPWKFSTTTARRNFMRNDDQPSPKIAAFVQACGAQCELEILVQDEECGMHRGRDPRLSGERPACSSKVRLDNELRPND